MDTNVIRGLIEKAMPDSRVQINDLVGDGNHLQAIVVSDAFLGKGLLEQHQMVYAPLTEILKDKLHALSVKTFTFEEWKLKKDNEK